MKKFIAGVMGFLMMGMVVVEAEAASRVSSPSRSSFSSSRSSSMSSSRSTYSAPKSYSAPAVSAPSRSSTSSNPGLKALGFSKPAPAQTVSRPSASVSSSRPTSTVSTGWFGKKSVSSSPAPSYRAPVRQVSSPVSYRNTMSSRPRTTVIQRNTYVNYGGYNGYNRGYGGYGYNPYGGYGYGGNSFVSGALGAVGGVMLYNALTTPHHTNSGATAAQIEQAKSDQRIEDKLDFQNQLLMQQKAPVVAQQPQCYLPPDAPLMMSPSFYCQPQDLR